MSDGDDSPGRGNPLNGLPGSSDIVSSNDGGVVEQLREPQLAQGDDSPEDVPMGGEQPRGERQDGGILEDLPMEAEDHRAEEAGGDAVMRDADEVGMLEDVPDPAPEVLPAHIHQEVYQIPADIAPLADDDEELLENQPGEAAEVEEEEEESEDELENEEEFPRLRYRHGDNNQADEAEAAQDARRNRYAIFFQQRPDSDNEQEEDEQDDEGKNIEHFDVNLPGRHLYLQDEDSDNEMPVLPPLADADDRPQPNADVQPPVQNDAVLNPQESPPVADGQNQGLPQYPVNLDSLMMPHADGSVGGGGGYISIDQRVPPHAPPPKVETIRLPVLDYSREHHSLLVMPGGKLPLRLSSPRDRAVVLAAMRIPQRAFVCLNLRQSGPTYGCILQIGQSREFLGTLHVIATATQRFRLHDVHAEHTGVVIADVEVLPEVLVTSPLAAVRLVSADRHLQPTEQQLLLLQHRAHFGDDEDDEEDEGRGGGGGSVGCIGGIFSGITGGVRGGGGSGGGKYRCSCRKASSVKWSRKEHEDFHQKSLNRKRALVQRHNSVLTPHPAWLYAQCDVYALARRVRPYLLAMAKNRQGVQIPSSPTDVCRYACLNLPLPDNHRAALLRLHCCHQRLYYILGLLERWEDLSCAECKAVVTKRDDVIIISAEGSQSAFVNPGGYVHEMITVQHTDNLRLLGRPTTEHSWFPGYAWTIANCGSCGQHVGWKFTAVRTSLRPKKFYGLTRAGVMPV